MGAFIQRIGVYVWHAAMCAAVLAFVLALIWATLYAISVRHRSRAERLLQRVSALMSPSDSDRSVVQRFSKDFNAEVHCDREICTYDVNEGFAFTLSGPGRFLRRTEWDYVGLRPWRVTVHLKTANARIVACTFDVLVGRGRGWLYSEGPLSGNKWAWLLISMRSGADGFQQGVKFEQDRATAESIKAGQQLWAGDNSIIIQEPNLDTEGSGQALTANLSPDAPALSRSVAFNVNLRCTTTFSPCTELCQLYPSAWQSYAQFQKSRGWYVEEPSVCFLPTLK